MTVSLFTFVDLFSRQLATASHLLNKGVAHAEAEGVSQSEMLGWRLIDDMAPLSFQLRNVCNFAQGWPARVAGLPVPAELTDDLGVAEFQTAMTAAKTYLASLTPEQFAGRDDIPLTFKLGTGMEPTLPSGQWLTVFATTNLYFHLSIAYAILRSKGVKIGKSNMFAGGL